MNHLSENLVTKGLLNISNITKGMIVMGYELVLRKKGGMSVSPLLRYDKEHEEDFLDNIRKLKEDVDVIKVEVNWNKNYNGNKILEARLIKDFIKAEILKETNLNIKIDIMDVSSS